MSARFHTENELTDVSTDVGKFLKKTVKAFDGVVDFERFTDELTGIIGYSSNVSFLGNINSNNKHNAVFLWDKWIGEI